MNEIVAVLDFGSQYAQLIARRVRELGVYSEIVKHDISRTELLKLGPKAIILSGGPSSVHETEHPGMDAAILDLEIPILGICYGMQLLAMMIGGKVEKGSYGEYGPARIDVVADNIFMGMQPRLDVWMSHGDHVIEMPAGFSVSASTDNCPVAAMSNEKRKIYAVQFHPEVVHTPKGIEIIRNFLFQVAGCKGDWTMSHFIEEAIEEIKDRVGDTDVICALSGGVDSAVTAALINHAVGNQMKAIFVDNGLLRAGEAREIENIFTFDYPMDIHSVNAKKMFLDKLTGIIDPERKRKIIGETFIDVFRNETKNLRNAKFLVQGTLYPDVIESFSAKGGPSVTIKTHHNVGGLPDDLDFELIEPLRELFKDEVRVLGKELGLPDKLLLRQPFPGPGLAVRIVGEITKERLSILRKADAIVQQEIVGYEKFRDIWQSFAVLLPVKSVGVMGDERTYANTIALRAVTSSDGMTADWVKLPYGILERISSRIINEVKGVNRVVYDISSKPPSTIEWE